MIIVVNWYPYWAYDTNVIMSNMTFNFASAVIIIMGFVSFGLSIEPNWVKMVKSISEYLTRVEPVAGKEAGDEVE